MNKRKSRAGRSQVVMMAELEARRMLTITFNAGTGVLDITGTAGDDNIQIRRDTNVTDLYAAVANSTFEDYVVPISQVKRINVDTLGGVYDIVMYSDYRGPINIPARLTTSAVTSYMISDSNNVTMLGGSGDDAIDGSAGAYIDGGAGNDYITIDPLRAFTDQAGTAIGGAGNDTIVALPQDSISGFEDFPYSSVTDISLAGQPVTNGQATRIQFGTGVLMETPLSQTFTITNNGSDSYYAWQLMSAIQVPYGFKLVPGTVGPLLTGESATFTVYLDNIRTGNFSGNIVLHTSDLNAGRTFTIPIGGTVVGPSVPPEISVYTVTKSGLTNINDNTATPIVFGGATTLTQAVRTFRVTNTGTGVLTTAGVGVPNNYVVLDDLATTLAPGQSDDFVVAIGKVSTGTKGGEIVIYNNDANEAPFNFAVTSNVVYEAPPKMTVSVLSGGKFKAIADGSIDIDFGTWYLQKVGNCSRTFRVTNSGPGILRLGPLNLPKGFVVLDPLASVLNPGQSDNFVIALNTSLIASRLGSLTFTTNDPANFDGLFTFGLKGTVIPPDWAH